MQLIQVDVDIKDSKSTTAITRRSTRTMARINYAALNGHRSPGVKDTPAKRQRASGLMDKPSSPRSSFSQGSTCDGDASDAAQRPTLCSKKQKVSSTSQRWSGAPHSKARRSYAPPETYAHLQPLGDNLKEGLDVIFCGSNPGTKSAQVGHYYANSRNYFWRCLHFSGFTPRQLSPNKDHTLPGDFNIGLTDIVERPMSQTCQLSKAEMRAGVIPFLRKIARLRPQFIAIVGKQIWKDTVLPELEKLTGRKSEEVHKTGLQPFKLVSQVTSNDESDELRENATLIYVVLSTSPAATLSSPDDKIASFAELKALVDTNASNVDTDSMMKIRLDFL